MGSQHKKKKGTDDTRIIIADVKDDVDLWSNKGALQPAYEGDTYIVPARTFIDFVNVSESVDASQTGGAPDTIPPAQVTGLSALALSSSQINLTWGSNFDPDLNHYDIYRSITNGFTVTLGVTVPVGSSLSNSYGDSGLNQTTTYYYRVGAVDDSANRGAVSTQASATTLAAGAIFPQLELHLDSTFVDTSSNAFAIGGGNHNGFVLPGAFGTAGWRCNTPTNSNNDFLTPAPSPAPSPLQMDTSVGFSISLWINPQDLSALTLRRCIIDSRLDATNVWSITIDSAGIAYFMVQDSGIDYKAQVSGFTTGSWQHLAATFNGATNTPIIYRNAVAGVASVAATQYKTNDPSWYYMTMGYTVGAATGTSNYVGYYDEIRYYKSIVLTTTQITNLKNTNAP